MTVNLIEIPKHPDKEVFTVKVDNRYYAVITGNDSMYMIPEMFDSPLKASNHARSLKRQLKIDVNIKKEQKTKVLNNTTKILRKKQFYTEAEMASETRLKFREVWLIVSPDNRYVGQVLKDNEVVKYVESQNYAFAFKTYEEATLNLKTLDMVVKKGHKLKRFFERRD